MSLVFYAVDSSPVHLFLAQQSLRSLRTQNKTVAVRFYTTRALGPKHLRFWRENKVDVIVLPKDKSQLPLPPTFLKWRALEQVKAPKALYVDADTWFSKDPLQFLDAYNRKHFYAREEYGTHPKRGMQLLGNQVLMPQIHRGKLRAFAKIFGGKPATVFNTGVMIFNHGFGSEIGARYSEIEEIYRFVRQKPAFYPGENWHIADEIFLSILLGTRPSNQIGRISKEHSPWYNEWKAGVVRSPGYVMHAWTQYAPFFLKDLAGLRRARALPIQIPAESRYREY